MLDRDYLHALAHPTRLIGLSLFEERAASARELGEEVGISGTAALYHVRVLEKAGLVHQVATRPRRAFDEALFRTRQRGWAKLTVHLEAMLLDSRKAGSGE